MSSTFIRIKEMNEAFGNPEGDPKNIDWDRIRSQCKNILDEFIGLQIALGCSNPHVLRELKEACNEIVYKNAPDLLDVRDALCDINVFSGGAHHLMGLDQTRDMNSVLDSLFTRFVKNEQDRENTASYHYSNGIREIAYEGSYPFVIARSTSDQPDAPKGKFLKSASYSQPTFYSVE